MYLAILCQCALLKERSDEALFNIPIDFMSACITCDQYDEMKKKVDFYKSQIDQLANFLLKEYRDELGRDGTESAIECAIRILGEPKDGS